MTEKAVALMDFGSAIWRLKGGMRVARIGWNGKGMHVELRKASINLNEHLALKNVKGAFDTWVPSISDLLAEDWLIVE